jgi:hypothetical protein
LLRHGDALLGRGISMCPTDAFDDHSMQNRVIDRERCFVRR